MTLDEFRATGRDVGDLSEYDTLEAQGLSGPGRVYEQELCLEGTAANGYHLTIGNESFTAPLRSASLRSGCTNGPSAKATSTPTRDAPFSRIRLYLMVRLLGALLHSCKEFRMDLIDCGKVTEQTHGQLYGLFYEGGGPPFDLWNGCQPNPCPRPQAPTDEPAPAAGE